MSTIPWGPGRVVTLTIANGGTTSDVLDLGAVSSYQTSGIASGVPTTTNIPTLKIGDAALKETDQLKGKYVVFKSDTTTANLRDQIRLITASTLAGVLTVNALTDAPVAGDTFDIVNVPSAGARSYRRWDVQIQSPATVTGTVNPQLSTTETAADFGTMQSGAADIVLPTGTKWTPLIPLVGRYLRIFGGAQGQITRFKVVGVTIDNGR